MEKDLDEALMSLLADLLLVSDPPRFSTPRGQVTRSERAIPPHLEMPKIPDDFFALVDWQILMDAYRVGKLDL